MNRRLAFLRRIEPYWVVIALFLIASTLFYLRHLQTGRTPDRAAFTIEALNLPVFWYGILIMGGVILGSWVTARLAEQRAEAIYAATVSREVQKRPLAQLDLPEKLTKILAINGIYTQGQLLLAWGLSPDIRGLKDPDKERIVAALADARGVDPRWIDDAPWRNWNPEHVWNGVLWCLVLGLIGARLYHILTPSPSMAAVGIESPLDYFRSPLQMFNVRQGGLGIFGGLAGGLLGLLLYTWRHRLNAIAWGDLAAVGLALGQYVGRWGNFVNQELYGRPTDLPWAVHIDPVHRLDAYREFARFHPAFLYESLWNLLTFGVLLTLVRRHGDRLRTGEVMALYLIFYGVGRVLLEMVRLDSRTVSLGPLDLQLSIATLVSLGMALAMLVWLIWHRRRPKLTPAPAQRD